MKTSNWVAPDVATLKTSDRVTLWIIAGAFAAFGLFGLIRGAVRVVELLGTALVRVELDLADTPVPGFPAGATASAIQVSVPPTAADTRALLVIESVFTALGWAAFYGLVALLLIQVARRIAFGRRMPALLMTAAFALLVGQGVSLQMHVAASASISADLDLDFAFTIDPVPLLVLPILLITLAFVLGAGKRIQKDTEGLV